MADLRGFEWRVWWIPQVPMEPFYVDVPDLDTARLMMETLAQYDLFQLDHRVKPDFSNAGGVEYRHPSVTGYEWESLDIDDEYEVKDWHEFVETQASPVPIIEEEPV